MEQFAEAINKLTDYSSDWPNWDYETLLLENQREGFIDPSKLIFVYQFGKAIFYLKFPFRGYKDLVGKDVPSIFEIELSAFTYGIDALSFTMITVGMLDVKNPVSLIFALRLMGLIKPDIDFEAKIDWYIAMCLVASGIHIFPKGIINEKASKEIRANIAYLAKSGMADDVICIEKIKNNQPLTSDREKECQKNLSLVSASKKRADWFWDLIKDSVNKIKEE